MLLIVNKNSDNEFLLSEEELRCVIFNSLAEILKRIKSKNAEDLGFVEKEIIIDSELSKLFTTLTEDQIQTNN